MPLGWRALRQGSPTRTRDGEPYAPGSNFLQPKAHGRPWRQRRGRARCRRRGSWLAPAPAAAAAMSLRCPCTSPPEWPAKPRHPPMPPHARRAARSRPPARAKGALLAARTFTAARLSPAPAPARAWAARGTAAGLERPRERPCGRALDESPIRAVPAPQHWWKRRPARGGRPARAGGCLDPAQGCAHGGPRSADPAPAPSVIPPAPR